MYVNRFIHTQSFKMDTLQVAAPYFPANGYSFTYDIRRGFHHLDVALPFRTYLGFSFQIKGVTFYARFTVCPFGLAPVPWLFTKIMKVLVSYWRDLGMIHFLYIDDGLGLNASQEGCAADAQKVRSDLRRLGFFEQPEKCSWSPSQKAKWLGFLIDLCNFSLTIPTEKLLRAKNALQKALSKNSISCRTLLRVGGLLTSLAIVYGTVIFLISKPLYICCQTQLDTGLGYDAQFPITNTLRQHLQACLQSITNLPPYKNLDLSYPTMLCFSDASDSGGSAVIHRLTPDQTVHSALPVFGLQLIRQARYAKPVFCDDQVLEPPFSLAYLSKLVSDIDSLCLADVWPHVNQTAIVQWDTATRTASSTHRELAAFLHGIQSLANQLANNTILWCTDNQAVETILYKGSSKSPVLHSMALQIFSLTRQHQINLMPLWVPRALNQTADALSRISDFDDWSISPLLFKFLNGRWGPHTVDRFSSETTNHLPRFYSRFNCPGAEGVDSFLFSWTNENNWAVPPPRLIARVVQHCRLSRAVVTLVIPYWPSSPFWPLFFSHSQPKPIISDFLVFTNAARFICPGPQPHSIFHPDRFHGSLVALRLNFS